MEKEQAHIYETIILKDNEVDEAAFEKGSFCMKPHTEFVSKSPSQSSNVQS